MKKILDQKCQNIFYQNIVKFAECSTIVGVCSQVFAIQVLQQIQIIFYKKKRWKILKD